MPTRRSFPTTTRRMRRALPFPTRWGMPASWFRNKSLPRAFWRSAGVSAMNDEDKVRNLQNAYGYYVDRKMWDDVTDLFTEDGTLEIADLASIAA